MKSAIISGLISITLLLFCGYDKEEMQARMKCLPSADLIITNSSEYAIIELYSHKNFNYINDSSKTTLAQNMAKGSSLNMHVEYGDSYYFTFIRKYFSTSGIDIAVTTERPVYIENCYKFSLQLLEEDFYLKKEDNF
jgi:hypothetical protein